MSKKNAKPYSEKIHIWGRISSITAIAALMLVPIAISAHYNAWPEAGKLFNAMKVVIPVYWISGIAEVFTYAPMLGAGGTYLSFVTGNITNLKLPCGLNAMENAGVRANSEEGEVISTIAIASSAITTTIILAVGVLAFRPVLPRADHQPQHRSRFQAGSARALRRARRHLLRKALENFDIPDNGRRYHSYLRLDHGRRNAYLRHHHRIAPRRVCNV